ncbi:MAG: LacI family DNA-binding transcriptional regulator [Candidatus Omnitrophica bacterium]|nr:LacI family DNA-binding transcriptional regulator [Candidatus Omnitrophota bacterium]MDD5352982.1 LacI family DNA-binding transcriptional regulator [Candidatus Omnitrophota bacterium]MDD5550581.1 LacI family DNA-binding transcriptional regulator [Candidatus Omnitrophota bacterium]
MAEKIRIEEVAKLAGVSPTTVSRVINKLPTVQEANRLKVEEAIRKLKFKPNVIAQRLAKGKSDTIALVIPRYEGIFFSFYANQIIRGVGVASESLKLDLLLHLSTEKSSLDTASVGGVLFADIISNKEELDSVLESGTPCVVMNYKADDLDTDYVAIDNKTGAKNAVEYLIHLGHRNIAHISGNLVSQAAADRLEGYKQALEKNNINIEEDFIKKGDYSRPSARKAMSALLKLNSVPTAVFVASDDMAQEAISVILENKLKVPGDISVVGFDDNPICLYGSVGLTTVKQPLIEMAAKATSLLHKIMSTKAAKTSTKIILPTELIIRDSCRQI